MGIPYYNLENTTPDGDNEGGITWAWEDGDGESEHGAIDEDDKLIWAWDDEEENEGSDGDDGNGEGQKDDKSKGDGASDDDSSRDEDDDDGITWFWRMTTKMMTTKMKGTVRADRPKSRAIVIHGAAATVPIPVRADSAGQALATTPTRRRIAA